MTVLKKDVKNFTLRELEDEIVEINEPRYRAKQIFSWLYKKGISNFNEIGNIPRVLKEKLEENYYISAVTPSEHLTSSDRTEKILFKLEDSNSIESVLIRAEDRTTLCLSTQVGCKFGCAFCASGRMGFVRNLSAPEIINQALYFRYKLKHGVTNYVFMGMGEPLDNYDNVTKAIAIMNDRHGMNIGARRMTVSTCGVIPGIKRLLDSALQVNLSVSLNAVNNKLRDSLMPINKLYPLEKLIRICKGFADKRGRKITLEYVLIKNINDSAGDADGLVSIAKELKAKVNLIPLSPTSASKFQTPERRKINVFMERLFKKGVNVTVRESKGKDIQAACGQLAGGKSEI